jgi:N-acetylglutamate synthase-like GNAT family acetyltransferase
MANIEKACTAQLGILAKEKRSVGFHIAPARVSDAAEITGMINNEAELSGAVIKVTQKEVEGWIDGGLSFVAKAGTRIVGHTAGCIWPKSGIAEHRAVVVLPEYRGNGINTALTSAFVQRLIEQDPHITIISLKNSNASEAAKKAVLKSGFCKIDVNELPDEIFDGPTSRDQYAAYAFNYSEVKALARS